MNRYTLILFSYILLLTSCSITSRRYMKGFYVDKKHKIVQANPCSQVAAINDDKYHDNTSIISAIPKVDSAAYTKETFNTSVQEKKQNSLSHLQKVLEVNAIKTILHAQDHEPPSMDESGSAKASKILAILCFAVPAGILFLGFVAFCADLVFSGSTFSLVTVLHLAIFAAFILSILSIVTGFIALFEASSDSNNSQSKKDAVTGIVVGILTLLLLISAVLLLNISLIP